MKRIVLFLNAKEWCLRYINVFCRYCIIQPFRRLIILDFLGMIDKRIEIMCAFNNYEIYHYAEAAVP